MEKPVYRRVLAEGNETRGAGGGTTPRDEKSFEERAVDPFAAALEKESPPRNWLQIARVPRRGEQEQVVYTARGVC